MTTITMIVGICVGSGIFFKADDVLMNTGGHVGLSVLVFIIGAFCVIFGAMTLTELAKRSQTSGGVVAYFDEFISGSAGNGMGWFYVFIYFPALSAVISWVSASYTVQLLGINSSLELEILIGFIYMAFFFALNYFSYTAGGRFQNITTVIKLIPLLGVALIGLFWTQPVPTAPAMAQVPAQTGMGWSWLAALAPIAFSFDGWIVSTTITHEVKKPHKTMPIALFLGPIIVLAIYLSYFLGLVEIIGSDYILAAGDGAVSYVGQILFGPLGDTLLTAFVLIAVVGVLNGVSLGYIRLPQSLAEKRMIPGSKTIEKVNPDRGLSSKSALMAFGISFLWLIIHYITQKTGMLGNSDVSEIAIVFSYLAYIILYVKVILMKKDGIITNPFFGYVTPVLAIIGSLIILLGGIISNPQFVPVFLVISFVVCVLGFIHYRRKVKAN